MFKRIAKWILKDELQQLELNFLNRIKNAEQNAFAQGKEFQKNVLKKEIQHQITYGELREWGSEASFEQLDNIVKIFR